MLPVWVMVLRVPRFRFIRAEPPCMKGEIQIGWLLVGWARAEETKDRG